MAANPKASRVIYDYPTTPPQESLHWKKIKQYLVDHDCNENVEVDDNSLKVVDAGKSVADKSSHNGHGCCNTTKNTKQQLNDNGPMNIYSHKELITQFQNDVESLSTKSAEDDVADPKKIEQDYLKVAIWNFVVGYCEALSTHKDATRRYSLYPLPFQALRQLVLAEFLPLLDDAKQNCASVATSSSTNNSTKNGSSVKLRHREAVQTVANIIWKRAQNKKCGTLMQDELHANSLYTCLCGDVDGKSLDCFGAASLVVVGMNLSGLGNSCLTLSEDHAYESHWKQLQDGERKDADFVRGTCEVAIPGNTKTAQSKRGRDISETFSSQDQSSTQRKKRNAITAETSWIYMAKNPVICENAGMVLAAMIGNVNCDVEKQKQKTGEEKMPVVSGPLYKLKRDLLWVLHDAGFMKKFPFALIELGDCEEHMSSARGMEWIDVNGLVEGAKCDSNVGDEGGKIAVLRNEKLFMDAIHISRKLYDDSQAYPYLCKFHCFIQLVLAIFQVIIFESLVKQLQYTTDAGHYHKDAGRDDPNQEYRLVESLRLYSEASRVASKYQYDSRDCMQLMKHMCTVASLIYRDILMHPFSNKSSTSSAGTVTSSTTSVCGLDEVVTTKQNAGNPTEGDTAASTSSSATIENNKNKNNNKQPRKWQLQKNAVAAITWLLSFYDSLLHWEEREEQSFVEILGLRHKHSFAKMLGTFDLESRRGAVEMMLDGFTTVENGGNKTRKSCNNTTDKEMQAVTENKLLYFQNPRSQRLVPDSLLIQALLKEKVVVKELDMAIPSSELGRVRKRTRQ